MGAPGKRRPAAACASQARYNRIEMESIGATFGRLTAAIAVADKMFYPLAELNDLLTAIKADEVEGLPRPSITDPYRLNYVTAMVELAAHRAGVLPPLWTA